MRVKEEEARCGGRSDVVRFRSQFRAEIGEPQTFPHYTDDDKLYMRCSFSVSSLPLTKRGLFRLCPTRRLCFRLFAQGR